MPGRSFGAFFVLSFLSFSAVAAGQACELLVDQPANTPTVNRSSGNQVDGSATLRITSHPAFGNWTVYLTSTLQFRPSGSGTFSDAALFQQLRMINAGQAVGTLLQSTAVASLEIRGNGDYRTTLSAYGFCNGVQYPLTPSGGPQPSAPFNVQRPTISGPGGGAGPYGIWWLGGGSDDVNGYYNRATLSANANGAPGTAHWATTTGGNKVLLSCISCTLPLVTSLQPSANCTYDVGIQMDFAGFKSPVYAMNVNAPFYMDAGLSSTSNFLDGWLTLVPYVNRDRCNYAMTSIALNEAFGPWVPDTTNNWNKPIAGGLPSYGGYTWYDQISVSNCPTCSPAVQQNNPPGQTAVDNSQQSWRIGSASVGSGIYVQVDTLRRYSGHGEHNPVTRILF